MFLNRKWLNNLSYLLLLAATVSRLPAQNFQAETFTIADGLSQGMIYDIEQTEDGFLWFATKDGLNRYDGYNFKVFTNDPFNPFSISGNEIGSMFEDSRGNLWLGIVGKGVDVLEKTSGKFLHLPHFDWDFATQTLWIEETPDGAIALATPNISLTIRWNHPFQVAENNADLRAYTTIAPNPNPRKSTLPQVLKDSKGHIYRVVGDYTNTKVFADSENGPSLLYETNNGAFSWELDRSDNLWLGTRGYGLQKIKLASQPFRHLLKGSTVGRLFALDTVYISFFSIKGTGTVKLDEASNRVTPVPALPPNTSEMFVAKNGVSYVISDNFIHNYLLVFKNGTVEKLQIDLFLSYPFTSIIEDLSGNIFATGGNGGLMRYEPATGKIGFLKLPKQLGKDVTIFALHLDARQNFWLGTSNGMIRVALADLKFGEITDEIPDGSCQIFQTDPANPHSLRYNLVTSFCPDPLESERYLWVGTKGGGLNLFDKTSGEFLHFTSGNSDLPNDVVYGILPGNNPEAEGQTATTLWGSTNRGLFRLTISSGEKGAARSYRFRNFTASDGLQDDEFNTSSFARAPDGRLFFGGVNGLTAFYPAEIKDRESDASVRFTDLKINNVNVDHFQKNSPLERPIHQTEHLLLAADQNLVTLEFALMDFANPLENRYRYRLEGVDPDWVNAGTNHVANYAHLRPGDYKFEVQGSISGGNWSTPATLRITVFPPWWASWWAYLFYLLALLTALYFFYKIRLRRKMEQQEALRLRELDEFKSHFFTNITHEFRTPLTVILGMSGQLAGGAWQSAVDPKEKDRVSSGLKSIERNGRNLLSLINQLLDLSKMESKSFQLNLEQGDIVPYLRYVTESFQTYTNSKNLSLRFFSPFESLVMDFDPEQIKQVLVNLISNAVKFTPSGGEINVALATEDLRSGVQDTVIGNRHSSIVIKVKDTGIGISPNDLPHIFDRFYQVDNAHSREGQGTGIGLAHRQEMVKAHGRGDLCAKSLCPIGRKGTMFTVRLPITNKAEVLTNNNLQDSIAEVPGVPPPDGLPIANVNSSRVNLLIIEDNPDVVQYLKACLADQYQLDVAFNGKIGIEKALENIPDLIVSDVMMPEKDGFQVCETLKNDERTSHIPIVLLTAKADAASRIAGLRRGADDYLSKPFDKEELLLRLEALVQRQQRMAAWFSRKAQAGNTGQLPEEIAEADILVEDAFMQKVQDIVAKYYSDENFGLPQLCQKIGMSRSQLFRKMTALIATSPSDFIRTHRLKEARTMLETADLTVSEVAWKCGFVNLAHFSKIYQEEFGVLPSATNK